jgi:plasmid stabilization system protein ParE
VSFYKVVLLEEALAELTESSGYYSRQSPELGQAFEEEVFQMLEVIRLNPLLFPIKFDCFHEAVLARFPFVFVYEVNVKEILVSAVFHTKRNPAGKAKKKS